MVVGVNEESVMRGLMGTPGRVWSLIARGGLRTVAVVACSAALLGAGLGLSAGASGGPGVPRLDRVFVIMMENTSYSDLLNPTNPNTTFIQSLAQNYGLATKYYG